MIFKQLKLYTYEEELFCYLVVIVAYDREQAKRILKSKYGGYNKTNGKLTEHKIKEGWGISGGGNG